MFVDFSNIAIPAQQKGAILDISGLVRVVTDGRILDTNSLCVGSTPTKDHTVWQQWRNAGFMTKVVPPANCKEEGIDDKLHNGILATIMNKENKDSAPIRTINLLSGDGNDNGASMTSFLMCLNHAIAFEYKVEVWSWKECASGLYKK
jgi:hypothetical protein